MRTVSTCSHVVALRPGAFTSTIRNPIMVAVAERVNNRMAKKDSKKQPSPFENPQLRDTLQQIEKQFGEGSIMPLGTAAGLVRIEGIPTGSLSLDMALGGQGIPRGRIIEI